MNELLSIATAELARFLSVHLPDLSPDWWPKHVVDRLSFQQQRMVQERSYGTLQQLDFAALLRVLDQNWYELANALSLPREIRTWVKELQTVRNKWAHLSAEAMPDSEVYRDADTLGRLLKTLGASSESLKAVESTKAAALAAMTSRNNRSTADVAGEAVPSTLTGHSDLDITQTPPLSAIPSMFKVGDLVALRSDPSILLPVIEVILGGAECRYRVFQNNARIIYYESQLRAAAVETTEHKVLTVRELHAHLTDIYILSPGPTANLFSLRSGRSAICPISSTARC